MISAPKLSFILLDNTVLSNFAVVGEKPLLLKLWPEQIGTTQAVLDEYRFAVQHNLLAAGVWDSLPIFRLNDEEREIANRFSPRLGVGERTCLAVAYNRSGVFASDDADARAVAKEMKIPVTGTLGILIRAVSQSLVSLPQANRLLCEMIAAGYRSPVDRLDALL